MSYGILYFDFVEYCPVIQFYQEGIPYRSLVRVMIVYAEMFLLETVDFSSENIDAGIGGGGIRAGDMHISNNRALPRSTH
jgi:hypothetical protein